MWLFLLYEWHLFGLYLSWFVCLSVGFLEKWDQCVINALRVEFYCSMPPTPPPPDRVPLRDTGPRERLKVQYDTIYILCFFIAADIVIVISLHIWNTEEWHRGAIQGSGSGLWPVNHIKPPPTPKPLYGVFYSKFFAKETQSGRTLENSELRT